MFDGAAHTNVNVYTLVYTFFSRLAKSLAWAGEAPGRSHSTDIATVPEALCVHFLQAISGVLHFRIVSKHALGVRPLINKYILTP